MRPLNLHVKILSIENFVIETLNLHVKILSIENFAIETFESTR